MCDCKTPELLPSQINFAKNAIRERLDRICLTAGAALG
jgi:hypothetical protein